MNLEQSIVAVLEATAALDAAVSADNLAPCEGLIRARQAALEAFAAAYDQANAAQKAACAPLLSELQTADSELQARCRSACDTASRDWNRTLGQSPAPRHEYDRTPELACLDRKA